MKHLLELLIKFIISFVCVSGYGVFFDAPKKSIIPAGIIGAFAWIIYEEIFLKILGNHLALVLSSLFIGIVGEILAKKLKMPSTVFIIPSIIPIVPGGGLYYTMLNIVLKHYEKAMSIGTEATLSACAIAFGIVLSTIVSKAIRHFKYKI